MKLLLGVYCAKHVLVTALGIDQLLQEPQVFTSQSGQRLGQVIAEAYFAFLLNVKLTVRTIFRQLLESLSLAILNESGYSPHSVKEFFNARPQTDVPYLQAQKRQFWGFIGVDGRNARS